MIRLPTLLLGIVGTVLISLLGLVFIPQWQVGSMAAMQLTDAEGTQIDYPRSLNNWSEAPGFVAYRAQGCIYCHSQQVRSSDFGADIARGWGERRSVPRDYILQDPPMLGTMRTGPDVANIGARQPSDAWHHLHLYDARLVSPGSTMPPFKFLYTKTSRNPGVMGFVLCGGNAPLWIVPSPEALALVAYIKSLHQAHSIEQVR